MRKGARARPAEKRLVLREVFARQRTLDQTWAVEVRATPCKAIQALEMPHKHAKGLVGRDVERCREEKVVSGCQVSWPRRSGMLSWRKEVTRLTSKAAERYGAWNTCRPLRITKWCEYLSPVLTKTWSAFSRAALDGGGSYLCCCAGWREKGINVIWSRCCDVMFCSRKRFFGCLGRGRGRGWFVPSLSYLRLCRSCPL